jgi:DegV family protein with EDD domain
MGDSPTTATSSLWSDKTHMGRVAIVTDSMAYLEPGLEPELDITVVPFNIRVGGKSFRDGIDISREEFFRQQERDSSAVSVLPPTVEQFQRAYTQVHARTDQVVSIHVSRNLSPVLVNAQRATEVLLGRCQIIVLDSLTSSLGLGILASSSARRAHQGATLDEVVRLIRGTIPHVYIVLYTTQLDYLQRSQHLSKSQAVLGSILGIKPILFLEDGRIMALEKVHTHERAVDKLFEFMAEFSDVAQAAILQRVTTPTAETRMLLSRLQTLFPAVKFPIVQYDPVLATHIGSSGIGVVVHESEA